MKTVDQMTDAEFLRELAIVSTPRDRYRLTMIADSLEKPAEYKTVRRSLSSDAYDWKCGS